VERGWTERSEDTVLERICIAACVVSLMHAIRDICVYAIKIINIKHKL
jgi:hypothetical protein